MPTRSKCRAIVHAYCRGWPPAVCLSIDWDGSAPVARQSPVSAQGGGFTGDCPGTVRPAATRPILNEALTQKLIVSARGWSTSVPDSGPSFARGELGLCGSLPVCRGSGGSCG